MRQVFDELWILDLGGEGRGARRSENVFAIQTPVAIAVGVRSENSDLDTPAQIQYARLDGTQEEKLAALAEIERFNDVAWQECFAGWTEPFLPKSAGDYFSWPLLTDLFPWQHSGVQFKRTWPIASDRETLERRWRGLVHEPPSSRARLFRETRDRHVDRAYPDLRDRALRLPALEMLPNGEPSPASVPYAYRALDRQYCLQDNRLADFIRPVLWRVDSSAQLFLTSLLTGLLGGGPAAVVSALVPDLHHFRGSFGGKDVMPLWRDAAAYVCALLAAPAYTARFVDELEVPGPRIPITGDTALFDQWVALGRELVWLHTFGERFVPAGERAGRMPRGRARNTRPIPPRSDSYPEQHAYDETRQELHVGEGLFGPVSQKVRWFSVSGLDVVGSWLDYRMRAGAGRRSSPLDEIRPAVWPAAFTEELLRVLWIVERTVDLGPTLDATLDAIVSGQVIEAGELPEPTDEERRAP